MSIRENNDLRRMIEDLKCCGNCKRYSHEKGTPCLGLGWHSWNECCKHWVCDGKTAKKRKAREKKEKAKVGVK